MGRVHEAITADLVSWIGAQHVFFVATAPLAVDGHVNLSPKGLDTFSVLDGHTVAYLDLTGSGVETIAHLRENGRITIMLCAFEGPPRIVRLHGLGTVHEWDSPSCATLAPHFPPRVGARAIVSVAVQRVADSCGYAVPRLRYEGDRHALDEWAERRGPDGLSRYRQDNNAHSIDGVPGLGGVTDTLS